MHIDRTQILQALIIQVIAFLLLAVLSGIGLYILSPMTSNILLHLSRIYRLGEHLESIDVRLDALEWAKGFHWEIGNVEEHYYDNGILWRDGDLYDDLVVEFKEDFVSEPDVFFSISAISVTGSEVNLWINLHEKSKKSATFRIRKRKALLAHIRIDYLAFGQVAR
jgi:hypothetical protein